AMLALEDGTVFEGTSFGAEGTSVGEVVFNTGMTGYQEVLTDPSYRGQIVTMTYTEIGNYGVNDDDVESENVWVEGFVVREYSPTVSNWRATKSLQDYLVENEIVGIEGIDTRMLTKHLRTHGAQISVLTTEDIDRDEAVQMAKEAPGMVGADYVMDVTCDGPRRWLGDHYDDKTPVPDRQLQLEVNNRRSASRPSMTFDGQMERPQFPYSVVCLDCGVKFNILRHLHRRGCEVISVPADSTAEDILQWKPGGVVLSNGPGDPEALDYVIDACRGILGEVPVFGICLGHQILGWALGGKTYKLKFGHRGCNHPVMNMDTEEVEITTQNHGFCVAMDSLPENEVEVTHVNLNDDTVEGMRHREIPAFSVQYHPEAGPGPHDANYLFDTFINMMQKHRENG
ncbi:MAG: glutamine-hydrolyzing carbamoyl-phosphate synthase small subunit, partial [Armatimonadota bacterium]